MAPTMPHGLATRLGRRAGEGQGAPTPLRL
jgi:hypothetical protein